MSNESQRICQTIADAHYAVHSAEDQAFSAYESPVFRNTREALWAAIEVACDLTPEQGLAVYDLWVRTGESIEWCAEEYRVTRGAELAAELSGHHCGDCEFAGTEAALLAHAALAGQSHDGTRMDLALERGFKPAASAGLVTVQELAEIHSAASAFLLAYAR